MIKMKKTVVCDKCKKNKPWVIIPESIGLKNNTVFCKECAQAHYGIDSSLKCTKCGISIVGNPCCKIDNDLFCSPMCAIQYIERYNEKPRCFTEDDENMLLGKDLEE